MRPLSETETRLPGPGRAPAGRADGHLASFTAPVREDLERMTEAIHRSLTPDFGELLPLVDHVGRYRGKQLRGAIVFLMGRAAGRLTEDHQKVAMIVELIHTATLVHDDILDSATTRRNLPTLNVLYGNEVPVLLGDYIYARAFHLSLHMADLTCSRILSEITRVVCQGEITQVLHRQDLELDEQLYLRIIGDKTASLYGAAAMLGAHYAGAAPAAIERCREYGQSLGLAFQIVDDVLDLEGDELEVGKSLGTDLEGGKLTLPLIHLLRVASPTERARLLQFLQESRRPTDSAGESRRMVILREFGLAGGLQYARDRAAHYVRRAQDCLDGLPASPSTEALRELAAFVTERRK
jgi:octaprenyl-diphosphate synthase